MADHPSQAALTFLHPFFVGIAQHEEGVGCEEVKSVCASVDHHLVAPTQDDAQQARRDLELAWDLEFALKTLACVRQQKANALAAAEDARREASEARAVAKQAQLDLEEIHAAAMTISLAHFEKLSRMGDGDEIENMWTKVEEIRRLEDELDSVQAEARDAEHSHLVEKWRLEAEVVRLTTAALFHDGRTHPR